MFPAVCGFLNHVWSLVMVYSGCVVCGSLYLASGTRRFLWMVDGYWKIEETEKGIIFNKIQQ
jgi:hypothetical protein